MKRLTAANPDDSKLIALAWHLDRLRWVPTAVLSRLVHRDGLCLWAYPDADRSVPTGTDTADRELAAAYCAGCPVQDECLELELRTAGEETAGVFGALPEQDRRALYPHWRRRGERAVDTDAADTDGGARP